MQELRQTYTPCLKSEKSRIYKENSPPLEFHFHIVMANVPLLRIWNMLFIYWLTLVIFLCYSLGNKCQPIFGGLFWKNQLVCQMVNGS